MKRILIHSLILFCCISVYAQRSPNTLISSDPEQISGFGGVLFSFVPIDGQLATLTGGGGAVLMDNTFFIGGYGLSMSGNRQKEVAGEQYSATFGHGGFWLGYILNPVNVFHFGIETKLGWGKVKYRSSSAIPADDKVFVFYPKFTGEANISNWMKVNAGLGYQKTVGVDDFAFSTTAFDGVGFSISLIFGWFN